MVIVRKCFTFTSGKHNTPTTPDTPAPRAIERFTLTSATQAMTTAAPTLAACKARPQYSSWDKAAGATMAYVRSEFQISFCQACNQYHIDWTKPEAERLKVDYSTIRF